MNKFPSDFFLPPRYGRHRMSVSPKRPSAPSCERYMTPKELYKSPKPKSILPTLRPVIHSPPKYFARKAPRSQTRSFDNSNKATPTTGLQLHKRLHYKFDTYKNLNFF